MSETNTRERQSPADAGTRTLNGSEIVIECLKEQGVKTIFGYPGGSIDSGKGPCPTGTLPQHGDHTASQ